MAEGRTIHGAVALVTGANRGVGAEFAKALLARGARTVLGGVRTPDADAPEGVTPVALDLLAPENSRASPTSTPT
jgi:NAD(P)-dependent dehydrogenase (short-subunit alcohol dehydrogenase family)